MRTMACRTPLLAACLLAALALASAGRLGGWGSPLLSSGDDMQMIKSKLARSTTDRAKAVREDVDRKGDSVDDWLDRMAFVAIKYHVPPSMHDKFIDEWTDLYKDVDKKEDNNMMYTLSKTMEDNVYFVTYGEWDTMADYIEHYHSGHMRDFLDFLEDNDITWELFPLRNVTSVEKEARRYRDPAKDQENKGKRKGKMAHILFHYHAEPSEIEDFTDEWEKMAEDAWDEDGNVVFSLRKIGTNNHHFMGYGSWDSWDDFMDHVESKHVQKFRDFAEERDILYFWEPIMRVEGTHDD